VTSAGAATRPGLVRHGLVALTAVGILAAAFELFSEHHWNGAEQLVPWVALAAVAAATVLVLLPGGSGVGAARVLALLVLGASVYGVVDHVLVNYGSGPLDERFADSWDALPLLTRLWYATSKEVGPAPTLAPGVLGQTALLLLLATVGAPRRQRAVAPG
jgi:hypothetical protein